jgi:hypothetical protein
MLLNRLDKQGQRDHPNLAEPPSVTARKFWYDTVCYGSKAAFACALEADHLVTGSDSPVLQDYEAYKGNFRLYRTAGVAQSRRRSDSPPQRPDPLRLSSLKTDDQRRLAKGGKYR